ncbi:hypothetical protein [Almyronema epifaneia]|uniref:Uncharacterized protein n=1 Tax=Almyronema epifaneia S1 TaxID=2991925 RepID=A0ABW6IDL3_9CYAN
MFAFINLSQPAIAATRAEIVEIKGGSVAVKRVGQDAPLPGTPGMRLEFGDIVEPTSGANFSVRCQSNSSPRTFSNRRSLRQMCPSFQSDTGPLDEIRDLLIK